MKSILITTILLANSNACFALSPESVSRRGFLSTSAITVPWFGSSLIANGSDVQPICVIGSNGRTGSKCVKSLLDSKIPVRAASRQGTVKDESIALQGSPLLMAFACDVTKPENVRSAVNGARAVIFAASASKDGGKPSAVDNDGLINVAKACLEYGVPHLVVVSSGGVSKPDSAVYKFLNLFGNIMNEKIKGEDQVREMYRLSSQGCVYTIIRPGGLTEDPARGVGALELNQGDQKSGRISREDVASLCIQSISHPANTGQTTFECYDADTGKGLDGVGLSNILKQKSDSSGVIATGKERRGNTWGDLFAGLEKDVN